MCEFRKLKASELQCKCTDTKFKGSATILIFKDARVDMKVLDETVGKLLWQKEYKEIDGKVYCGVGIYNKDLGQFIWKYDCGTEGNFETEKSEASDAFKRACFNWGIGRELYDTPKIKIKCPDSYYYNDKLTMTFTVSKIEWEGDNLMQLVIVDKFGKKVYDFTEKPNDVPTKETNSVTVDNATTLKNFCSSMKGKVETKTLKAFYDYWSKKIEIGGFTGAMNPSSLWNKWIEKERKPQPQINVGNLEYDIAV